MDTLNMKRTKSDRVHRPDCSHLPPFPSPWYWPDEAGITSYEAVAEHLRADTSGDLVKPCRHCLPPVEKPTP